MSTRCRTDATAAPAARQGAALTLALALALGGCGGIERFYESRLSPDTPVEWWYQLQGGRVAQGRPPPPGATDPYPNIATVPNRPEPTDPAARRALQASLAGQRDGAARDAANDPLPLGPAAALQAVPTRPPRADPAASMATLDAAEAPAPRAAPPSAPLASAPPASSPALPPSAARTASGPLPALPDAPPAPPAGFGLPPVPAAAAPPAGVAVAFAPGSAELPAAADPALRALAVRRGEAGVLVTADGEARGATTQAQAAGLDLALRRARAIADAVVRAGVPEAAVRLSAAGLGRGASARLVE